MAFNLHPMPCSTIVHSPDGRGYVAWSITPKRKKKNPADKGSYRIAEKLFEFP
jgi:hypothetical protein